MTTPAERAFVFFEAGQVREELLADFRNGLRRLVNPETGVVFTEDEIAVATQRGSRFWREADAIDLMGQSIQSRALYLADQVRPERAADSFLFGFHGELWGMKDPLPASPGAGAVTAIGATGTTYVGSTTIPDPAATTARDQAGLRYQVFTSGTVGGSGQITLTLVGIDTGDDTNLKVDDVLTWINPPLGSAPTCTVAEDFSGGVPAESSAEFAARLKSRIRHKPASGNASQFRGWARDVKASVQDAFIYPCAFHAGSVLVCLTQKRGVSRTSAAQQANSFLLATATARLVPPGSPLVPERVFVLVTTFNPQPSDLVLALSQPKGNGNGWADVNPWPGAVTLPAAITAITNSTHFRISSDTPLPNGASVLSLPNAPQMMIWDPVFSSFVPLAVQSVIDAGGGLFDVVLTTPIAFTSSHVLTVGDRISPLMGRAPDLALSLRDYFDGLGPGELVPTTDSRWDRAARFPEPAEEWPSRAGQGVISKVIESLGSSLADGLLISMSQTSPTIPTNIAAGPNKLTLGNVGVYDLP